MNKCFDAYQITCFIQKYVNYKSWNVYSTFVNWLKHNYIFYYLNIFLFQKGLEKTYISHLILLAIVLFYLN